MRILEGNEIVGKNCFGAVVNGDEEMRYARCFDLLSWV